jgi:starvation-inducible DNA-binding protein
MNELVAAMRIVLANNFVMYFRAHSYHWNVEGIEFSQYHDFFGDLYNELFGAADTIAEEIRALDSYAPISLMEMYNYKTIEEDSTRTVLIADMLTKLQDSNNKVLESLNKAYELANSAKELGLANFLQDRMDKHKKHGWMIRASLKKVG